MTLRLPLFFFGEDVLEGTPPVPEESLSIRTVALAVFLIVSLTTFDPPFLRRFLQTS